MADRHNECGKMRYFTPELYLQLQSADDSVVDKAMEQWDAASASYRNDLERLRREMPPQIRPITELRLHDWNLVDAFDGSNEDRGMPATIVLKDANRFTILCYWVSGKVQRIDPPPHRVWYKDKIQWLYDEIDLMDEVNRTFVHRILFSDGTTLLIPFSDCRVLKAKSDHTMSHADLVQIA